MKKHYIFDYERTPELDNTECTYSPVIAEYYKVFGLRIYTFIDSRFKWYPEVNTKHLFLNVYLDK